MEATSLVISIVALLVSLATFWLTRYRKGTIKMTKPTVIFLGPDGPGEDLNKIFIRTLLYSSSDRGQYIENMYIRLSCGKTVQDFNIWVYGEEGKLARGSGLFIGKHGLAANHHFLLPKDGLNFTFKPGEYHLEVYAELINRKPIKIYTQSLTISREQSKSLHSKEAGVYFVKLPFSATPCLFPRVAA